MSTLSLRLPESLHKQLKELAKQEGVSINQLAVTALAEKMSALMTGEYLEERAQRGSRRMFEDALERIKDTRPDQQDEL
jgi:post-segregation antitoxin (ccd killing protein)